MYDTATCTCGCTQSRLTAPVNCRAVQDNHISPSAYIAFALPEASAAAHPVLAQYPGTALLIWTTTPWTIPANMALAVHADFEYSLVAVPPGAPINASHILVVSERLDDVRGMLYPAAKQEAGDGGEGETAPAPELDVVATMSGASLGEAGLRCQHPLVPERQSIVFCADHITADSGTGYVGACERVGCAGSPVLTCASFPRFAHACVHQHRAYCPRPRSRGFCGRQGARA